MCKFFNLYTDSCIDSLHVCTYITPPCHSLPLPLCQEEEEEGKGEEERESHKRELQLLIHLPFWSLYVLECVYLSSVKLSHDLSVFIYGFHCRLFNLDLLSHSWRRWCNASFLHPSIQRVYTYTYTFWLLYISLIVILSKICLHELFLFNTQPNLGESSHKPRFSFYKFASDRSIRCFLW